MYVICTGNIPRQSCLAGRIPLFVGGVKEKQFVASECWVKLIPYLQPECR